MILDKVKQQINMLVSKKKKFIFHGSRNQNEEFVGVITKLYPAIFLIELEDGQRKTYSYNDVLIGNLEIID